MMAVFAGALFLVFINNDWEPGKRIQWVWPGFSDGTTEDAASQDLPPASLEPQLEVPQRTAEMEFWEELERDREAPRQTSFDDTNYTPSKQINIIQSLPFNPSQIATRKQPQGLRGSAPAMVHWQDARGRITRWQTHFEFENSRIDNRSFCLNLRKGSLEYRECRKGAREWLKGQCRTSANLPAEWRRMYCNANSSYRT
jgi:hypothetical protein